jgi:hypothetical protein
MLVKPKLFAGDLLGTFSFQGETGQVAGTRLSLAHGRSPATSTRIRNWSKFQHYKFRKPAWIKLYREILDDPEWHNLPGESAKGLIMLWLIASEDNGYLPDSKTLAFRLRISENRVIALLSDCSAWLEHDASTPLAPCYQDAIPEKSRVETEKRQSSPAKTAGGSLEGFIVFWEAYPRKLAKQDAQEVWVKKGMASHLTEILASLADWKNTSQWHDGLEHIPYPATWLNKGRWKDNVRQAVTNIKTKSLEEQLKELEDGSRSKANAN